MSLGDPKLTNSPNKMYPTPVTRSIKESDSAVVLLGEG